MYDAAADVWDKIIDAVHRGVAEKDVLKVCIDLSCSRNSDQKSASFEQYNGLQ